MDQVDSNQSGVDPCFIQSEHKLNADQVDLNPSDLH